MVGGTMTVALALGTSAAVAQTGERDDEIDLEDAVAVTEGVAPPTTTMAPNTETPAVVVADLEDSVASPFDETEDDDATADLDDVESAESPESADDSPESEESADDSPESEESADDSPESDDSADIGG